MSTILNDRDVQLQATVPRFLTAYVGQPALTLSSSAPVFRVSNLGSAAPASTTVTAELLNMSGTVSWSSTGLTGSTPSGNTITFTAANMSGTTATVTASVTYNGTTYTRTTTVSKILDGTNGTNGTNGADGAAGTNGAPGVRGTVTVTASGSWSDANANAAIAAAGYGVPQNRDIVTLYSGSSSTTKFYQSGVWNTMTAYVDGNMLITGTVSASVLAADTMIGQTIKTATSGARIEINSGVPGYPIKDNEIRIYNSTGNVTTTMGGTYGNIRVTSFNSPAYIAEVYTSGSSAVASYNSLGYAVSATTDSNTYRAVLADGGIETYGNGGNAMTIGGGANGIVQSGGGPNWFRDLLPVTSNAYSLGSSGQLWGAIYATTSTITTSDARTKTEIRNSSLGLDFINDLRPVAYKQIVATHDVHDFEEGVTPDDMRRMPYTVTLPKAGVRDHFGFISQEVRQSLVKHGAPDAAIWTLADKDDPDSQQALRYEELIAPLVRAVQELSAEVATLKAQLKR